MFICCVVFVVLGGDMGRNLIRFMLILLLLALIVGGSLTFWRFSARAYLGPNAYVSLPGHTVPLTLYAQSLQDTASNQPLALSISLQPQNEAALDNLLQQLYDPTSPNYQQFLTPDQFQQLFSPSDSQVQEVVSYLQGQGLTVTNVSSNNLLIDASGNVGQAQQAFHVQIRNYLQGKQAFYANSAAPQVPGSLSSLIGSISGLDNSVQLQPEYRQSTHLAHNSSGYGPQDLASAYDIAPLQNMGLHGDGQTVALLELDGYQPSDVAQYVQHYLGSSPPPMHTVQVDGFNGSAGTGAVEVEMDMEIIAGLAPHATQLVYEGPNTNQGVNDTYNRIVTDNKAQVVSISWGICEAVNGAAELKAMDTIFKQGAAQGISFFAAAGDAGAYDCKDTNLGVDSPASDPYVTAVGGTTLQIGNSPPETVWSDNTDSLRAPKGSGGGGGLSNTYKQPKWQYGPGVKNRYSNGNREVPDVAANADPNQGYAVYCTVHNAGCSPDGWLSLGGTSAAAPVWAGSALLLNQYLHNQGKARLGFANPTLYTLASDNQPYTAFNDITVGNNLYYPAGPNYDLASGLGTPDLYNMARDLAGVPNGVINTPTVVAVSQPQPTVTDTPQPTVMPIPTLAPANGLSFQDSFGRSDQAFWGTASDGNVWGGDVNNSTSFSISGGNGQVTGTSTSVSAVLGSSVSDAEVLFSGSLSAYGGANMGAVLRWSDGNNWYKGYIDGTNLIIQRKVNGVTSTLASVPFSATAGTTYNLHFRIVGTTLSLNVWPSNQSEPTDWMASANDSSFQSGYSGLRILAPGSVVATITAFQANTL
jgi:subtilase family serine protease